jgi:hypothetical protein
MNRGSFNVEFTTPKLDVLAKSCMELALLPGKKK